MPCESVVACPLRGTFGPLKTLKATTTLGIGKFEASVNWAVNIACKPVAAVETVGFRDKFADALDIPTVPIARHCKASF